jgi:hypothetical protein
MAGLWRDTKTRHERATKYLGGCDVGYKREGFTIEENREQRTVEIMNEKRRDRESYEDGDIGLFDRQRRHVLEGSGTLSCGATRGH